MLMGGANSSFDDHGTWLMNDTNSTWAFVRDSLTGGFHWIELHPTNSPPALFGASMAYDAALDELVLYGGAQNGTSTANGSCSPVVCPHFRDTWGFSGDLTSNSWVELYPGSAPAPPGSVLTDMVYDPVGRYIIDFGGQDNGYKSLNATQNATWAFTASGWQNITPTASPGPRFGAAITFDNATAQVLMIGGLSGTVTDSPLSNDFWAFADGSWVRLGPNETYPVTFAESGLPNGASWNVTVLAHESGLSTSSSSATRDIVFEEPTGKYTYSVGLVPGYHTSSSGSFSVLVAPLTVDVSFFRTTYEVRFTESGLNPTWHTRWCVNFNASEACGTSVSLAFGDIPNGSFSYSIGHLTNYSLKAPFTGTVVVDGKSPGSVSNTIKVLWHLVVYSVIFEETGLSKGAYWTVVFDGQTKVSSSSRITFSVSNGTYRFGVNATGFIGMPANGTLMVDGSVVTQHEVFGPAGPSVRLEPSLSFTIRGLGLTGRRLP